MLEQGEQKESLPQVNSFWEGVIKKLENKYNHNERNNGLIILQCELTSTLLKCEEAVYMEGVELVIGATNDENYTVRDYTPTILCQILEATQDSEKQNIQELYDQVFLTMEKLQKDSNRTVKFTARDEMWVYKKRNRKA